MRAATIESFGQTPTVVELPAPDGSASLLGTVLAAGINPVDLLIATGEYAAVQPKPPYTPGMEGVARRADGSVVYFGRPGDLRHGSLGEQVLLDPEQSFPVPDGVDPADAIGCGIAGLSAWLAVTERGRVREGDKVVVTGATGAAGRIAIQAARLAGAAQIVAIGRDEAGLERARELGATDVLRWCKPMLPHQSELSRLTGGHDLIIDFTWGPPAVAAIMAAATGARHVQVGSSASLGAGITASDLRGRQLDLLGFNLFNVPLPARAAGFATLLGHVQAGRIAIDAERVALDDVPEAWERQRSSPGAKLVALLA